MKEEKRKDSNTWKEMYPHASRPKMKEKQRNTKEKEVQRRSSCIIALHPTEARKDLKEVTVTVLQKNTMVNELQSKNRRIVSRSAGAKMGCDIGFRDMEVKRKKCGSRIKDTS